MKMNEQPKPESTRNPIENENFYDDMDLYNSNVYKILNSSESIDEFTRETLMLGLKIINRCKHELSDLDFYRKKFTAIVPLDLELSPIRKCYIGRCSCGQLLIQDKGNCCAKCLQMISWPKDRP